MAEDLVTNGLRAGSLFDKLKALPADPLLALIGAYRDDPRANKIDVGVGVYRTESGATPVFAAVKEAERRLVELQTSKGYLGPEGDVEFFERLQPWIMGAGDQGGRVGGLQTPGGTGALRLAVELVAAARPGARILVGTPTWPNHMPILAAGGLELVTYQYFDVARQSMLFDQMVHALMQGRPGDIVLLHGCCHNPAGADLDDDQWQTVSDIIARRGLTPLIDLAYHGLGRGLEPDAFGARYVLSQADEALLAYSCDKNFGLYRERTGALYVLGRDRAQVAVTQSNLLALARANWSMPPDHGAAVVRMILADDELVASWTAELDQMRARMVGVRSQLAPLHPMLAPLAGQHGMFSMLPLAPAQVEEMRATHGVYMAPSGRINVAGLNNATVPRFAAALAALDGRVA